MKKLNLRIPMFIHNKLGQLACKTGETKSSIVRIFLEKYLKITHPTLHISHSSQLSESTHKVEFTLRIQDHIYNQVQDYARKNHITIQSFLILLLNQELINSRPLNKIPNANKQLLFQNTDKEGYDKFTPELKLDFLRYKLHIENLDYTKSLVEELLTHQGLSTNLRIETELLKSAIETFQGNYDPVLNRLQSILRWNKVPIKLIGDIHCQMGKVYSYKNNLKSAFEHLQIASEYSNPIDYPLETMILYVRLIFYWIQEWDLHKARFYIEKLRSLAQSENNQMYIQHSEMYSNILDSYAEKKAIQSHPNNFCSIINQRKQKFYSALSSLSYNNRVQALETLDSFKEISAKPDPRILLIRNFIKRKKSINYQYTEKSDLGTFLDNLSDLLYTPSNLNKNHARINLKKLSIKTQNKHLSWCITQNLENKFVLPIIM